MSYASKLILAACTSLLCLQAMAQSAPATVKQVALKTESAAVQKIDEPLIEPDIAAESRSARSDEYRRGSDERVYEAAVISVRAVMGRPQQRCWVEATASAGKAPVAEDIIGREPESTQLISRCQSVQSGAPDYWDVTYRFRNVEHTVQMSTAPGQVMYVNKRGEPRL